MLSLRQPSPALFFSLIIPSVPSQLMHYPRQKIIPCLTLKRHFLHYSLSILLEVELNTLAGTTGFNKKGHFTDKVNSMNSLNRRDEEITLFSRKQILPLAGPLRCFAAELMYIH